MDALAPGFYEFGAFRLDAGRRVLCVQGESKHLAVSSQVFEAIFYRPAEVAGPAVVAQTSSFGALGPDPDVRQQSCRPST